MAGGFIDDPSPILFPDKQSTPGYALGFTPLDKITGQDLNALKNAALSLRDRLIEVSQRLASIERHPGTGGALLQSVPCEPFIQVGDLVCIRNGAAELACADSTSSLPSVGAVTEKIGPALATVVGQGKVSGVYSGLTPGFAYFVGLFGRPARAPIEAPPGTKLFAQRIGIALDETTLLMNVSLDVTGYTT